MIKTFLEPAEPLEDEMDQQDQNVRGSDGPKAQRIPQRRDAASSVFSLPLTRRQRAVSFLIDGQRSLVQIAQMCDKDVEDVAHILSEAELWGLIQ